jgi:hypothetical protein
MIAPLVFDQNWWRRPGISQITTFTVTMTYDPQSINRVIQQSPNDLVTYNNVTVIVGQPSLTLFYYTLPTYMAIPPVLSYPNSAVQNYVYNFSNTITPAVPTFKLARNTIRFQNIPQRLYISVSKASATKTRQDTDSFLPITNINITWGNVSGVLSTLTQQDLYLLCLKNGLKQSWAIFSGQRFRQYGKYLDINTLFTKDFYGPSAPICLEFGSDIQLLNEDFVDKQGTWNFQVEVTCLNNRSDNYTPQPDIVVVCTGSMTIADQSVTLNTGLVAGSATPGPEVAKVSYPPETELYVGGKFRRSY